MKGLGGALLGGEGVAGEATRRRSKNVINGIYNEQRVQRCLGFRVKLGLHRRHHGEAGIEVWL